MKTKDLKFQEPIIKKGYVYRLNRGLFLDLLMKLNKVDYKFLPVNISRTIGFNLSYDLMGDVHGGFNENDSPIKAVKKVLRDFESSEYFFESSVRVLKKLIALCILHIEVYNRRLTTEQLNYKLF